MNYYKCSDGSRISKAQIDRNVREAKPKAIENQKDELGFNCCVECLKNGYPDGVSSMELGTLDCSHVTSVKECQETGHSEKAWDVDNIEILCRFHHKIRDGLNLKFK